MTRSTYNDNRDHAEIEKSDVATIQALRATIRHLYREIEHERGMKEFYMNLLKTKGQQ